MTLLNFHRHKHKEAEQVRAEITQARKQTAAAFISITIGAEELFLVMTGVIHFLMAPSVFTASLLLLQAQGESSARCLHL